MRNSFLSVALLGVLALGAPAFADDNDDSAARIRELNDARTQALVERAAAKMAQSKAAREAGNDAEADRLAAEADQLYSDAITSESRATGMVGNMERVEAEIENEKEMYDQPGFWDKVGDKSVDIIGDMIAGLIKKWMDGGGQDDDLLNRVNELQDERDRLLNERDNGMGDGVGAIITDPAGNYGYDRDGDGYVDIPLNPDGTPAGPYNPSDDDAYGDDDLASALDDLGGLGGLPGSFGGGGASMGGNSGPGFGGIGAGGIGPDGQPLAAGEEGGFDADAEDADKDGEDGDDLASAKSGEDKDGNGVADDEERDVENFMGRIMVLPKAQNEDGKVAGNREESGDWSDDFEEWGDDDWDDTADNGDADKDKDADTDSIGDGKDEAKLTEELMRVQSVIDEWRKLEAEENGEDEGDSFGFEEDDMSGYHASGDDGKKEDLLKDCRDDDGKIDLTKVDLWLIDRDTWKKGEKPVRYKLEASLDLKDFDPIPGGVLVCRGVAEELDVKESVLDTIKGEVKKLEIVSVILSAEKPPENMDSLDPSKTKDSDVGGLEEGEDEGAFEDDGDW